VVGTSGSGKSTLARQLAAAIDVPYVELDSIFHQPGWQPLPEAEFQEAARRAADRDGWIIDGNYSAVRSIIWARADTVVWFDLPRGTVMRQLTWRTLRRAMTREELWNGNREPWQNFFSWDPEKSVISWAWHKHAEYRVSYSRAAADPAYRRLRFVQLKNRRAARSFLQTARAAAPARSAESQ
jgi:adenylate kinase family enzyme